MGGILINGDNAIHVNAWGIISTVENDFEWGTSTVTSFILCSLLSSAVASLSNKHKISDVIIKAGPIT